MGQTPKTAAPVAGQLVGFHFHDMLLFPKQKREQYQCRITVIDEETANNIQSNLYKAATHRELQGDSLHSFHRIGVKYSNNRYFMP